MSAKTPLVAARPCRAAIALSLLIIVASGLGAAPQAEAGLLAYPAPVLRAARHSVFEVVLPVRDDSRVTYDTALQDHMIPFGQRAAEYRPIGTAFYVGDGLYVSAAHVFQLEYPNIDERIFLRSRQGQLVEVDQVVAFSSWSDFVVFTLTRAYADAEALPQVEGVLNTRVYSIGSARSDGLVIRDGVLINRVPDPETGKPLFLDTTVPVSAGHSGGPLLNEHGEVVGINIQANRQDDLFRAVPITDVLPFRRQYAVLDDPINYWWLVPDVYGRVTQPSRVPLPGNYLEVGELLKAVNDQRLSAALKQIYPDNAALFFPYGSAATNALVAQADNKYIEVATRHVDGLWYWDTAGYEDEFYPAEDGYVERVGDLFTEALRVELPPGQQTSEWWEEEERILEYALQGYRLQRDTVSLPLRVTSLGVPVVSRVINDRFDRPWRQAIWEIPFYESYLSALIAPTPNGFWFLFLELSNTEVVEWTNDMEVMLDFVRFPLSGSPKQWNEYLRLVEKKGPTGPMSIGVASADEEITMNIDVEWARVVIPLSQFGPDSTMTIRATFDFVPNEGEFVMAIDELYVKSQAGHRISLRREVNPGHYPEHEPNQDWDDIALASTVGTVEELGWASQYIPDHKGNPFDVPNAVRVWLSLSGSDEGEKDVLQWVIDRSQFDLHWVPATGE